MDTKEEEISKKILMSKPIASRNIKK